MHCQCPPTNLGRVLADSFGWEPIIDHQLRFAISSTRPLSGTMTCMSIKVSPEELSDELRRWGFGFLITVGSDGASHVISLMPEVVDDGANGVRLRFDAGGGRACRNVAEHAAVTIVFPPRSSGDGFSLLVDGDAIVEGDIVVVAPSGAVLHRPAPPLPGLQRVDWGSEADYRARVSRDGFADPSSRPFEVDPDSPLHGHEADVRGLVVSGTFVLRMDGADETFESGDGFELASGTLHAESSGDAGATVLLALR